MSPLQTIYTCSNCEAQFPKWQGRCLECGAWGTVVQSETVSAKSQKLFSKEGRVGKVVDFKEVTGIDYGRLKTGIEEFDRVLGGGIVPGSLILLGGEPGIGKSTLVLQVASALATMKEVSAIELHNDNYVLYISGEESANQIKMRLDRLLIPSDHLQFLGETDINNQIATIEKIKPRLTIIDSIQTMYSPEIGGEPGSISQVRLATNKLMMTAKKLELPILIIGHVTKEGMVAGPKTLEHLVDTVLYLEGERLMSYRLLKTVKNRFGPTDEVGVFEMKDKGMIEVKDPSLIFISDHEQISGSVITCVIEGTRPFLVEIQALVNKTIFGYPQRRAIGFDLNRLIVLIAVLTRRAKINLLNQDVFLNIMGGLKVNEPAADLAIALAIVSAFLNKPVERTILVLGEVGLGGEIRAVPQTEKRINEAVRFGFEKVIAPRVEHSKKWSGIVIKEVKNLGEAVDAITES